MDQELRTLEAKAQKCVSIYGINKAGICLVALVKLRQSSFEHKIMIFYQA